MYFPHTFFNILHTSSSDTFTADTNPLLWG